VSYIYHTIKAVSDSQQSFYAHRVRVVSGGNIFLAVCWILSALRAVLGIFIASQAFISPSVSTLSKRWRWVCALILALGTFIDFLLAVLLSAYLKLAQRTSNDKVYVICVVLHYIIYYSRHLQDFNYTESNCRLDNA